MPQKNAAYDLHALSTPPTFILSQDQTLNKERKFIWDNCTKLQLFKLF